MKRFIEEDWEFKITVLSAKPCRIGLEEGDEFPFTYATPGEFCPKTMAVVHSLCEAARSGGDYRLLGGKAKDSIEFCCADGVVRFLLTAPHLDIAP